MAYTCLTMPHGDKPRCGILRPLSWTLPQGSSAQVAGGKLQPRTLWRDQHHTQVILTALHKEMCGQQTLSRVLPRGWLNQAPSPSMSQALSLG